MTEYNQDLDVGKHRLLKSSRVRQASVHRSGRVAEVMLESGQDEEDIAHGQAVAAAWSFCWIPSVRE